MIVRVSPYKTAADAALFGWTFTAGLRVSPSLAAVGFQEIRPVLALDIASKGDAITGIYRAEGAT